MGLSALGQSTQPGPMLASTDDFRSAFQDFDLPSGTESDSYCAII
jgi:hypothetical protein